MTTAVAESAADHLAVKDVAEFNVRLAEVETRSAEKVAALEKQIFALQEELKIAKVGPNTATKDLPCFLPFKREDGRVITSSIAKDTSIWYQNALLYPHEPLRRDMLEVQYLLKNHVKPDEPWKLVNFFHWYNVRFVRIVHAHHDTEEQIFFPAVSKRVKIPEKTTADHKMLMKGLDEVTEIGKAFKANGGNESNIEASSKILPQLTAKWEEITALMLPHLAEEEEQMVTFIKDKFTEKEYNAVVDKILKSEGLGNARLFLPSIVESMDMWGTSEQRAEFRTKVPAPIRFFLKTFWAKPYEKYHRGVLNSLRSGAPKQIIKEKTGFFA